MHTHAPAHHARFAHPKHNTNVLGIESGMSVADFGAGSGHYVWSIAELAGEGGHIFAVDVQQDLLKRIKNEAHKRGFSNIDVLWGDLERMGGSKLPDRSQDFVLVSNLLFQVSDKLALLREARRTLKPMGRMGIIDWSDITTIGPHRTSIVSKQGALDYARAAGFEIVREFDAGAHHYGLIMRPVAISLSL